MAAEQLAELTRAEEVPPHGVLQVLPPIESDRSRDVGVGVARRVLVDLDDADVLVVQVLLQPVGLDEHVLGVIGHGDRPSNDES